MIRVFLFVLLVSASAAFPQRFPSELWHEGKVVLDTGDTLKGTVKYDLNNDLLQVQTKTANESLTARKVLFFEIFDGTSKTYRQFFSLPYTSSGSYKAPVFFELIQEGKLTILCREQIEFRTYSSPYYYYGSYTRRVLVYKYFRLEENGDIQPCVDKKGAWLELMGRHADDVEKYARLNRLSFDDRYELSKIIEYYNSLFKQP